MFMRSVTPQLDRYLIFLNIGVHILDVFAEVIEIKCRIGKLRTK